MKPTLVFAPGAWHTPSYFDQIRHLAHSEGYPSSIVSFPTYCGASNPPLSNNEADVVSIRTVVCPLVESGKEVILIMHSYAGIPGCSALKGLSRMERMTEAKEGGVTGLLFVAALLSPVGVPYVKWLEGINPGGGPPMWQERTEDGKILVRTPQHIFYNDLPPEIANEWSQTLEAHSGCLGLAAVTYPAWEHIPATWVLCEKDQTKPLARQIAIGKIMGREYKTERLDSGHTPFLSMPGEVLKLIRKMADEQ